LQWVHFPSDQLTSNGGDVDCANSPYDKHAAKNTAAKLFQPDGLKISAVRPK
jgi:hypothetical protein